MMRYLRRRLTRRLVVLGLVVAAATLAGGGIAEALPPTSPPFPYEGSDPGVAPGGKTKWRAIKHLPGGAAMPNGPTRTWRSTAKSNGGFQATLSLALSEVWIDGDDLMVTYTLERNECDLPGFGCGYPAEESPWRIEVGVFGLYCYDQQTRTIREVYSSGAAGLGWGLIGGGFGASVSAGFDGQRHGQHGGRVPYSNPGRCSGTYDRPIGVIARVQIRDESSADTVLLGTWLEWIADNYEADWGNEPSMEQCVMWFGETWTPEWPERYDGKTPAEVGCDRYKGRQDDGTDFASVCRNPPDIEYVELGPISTLIPVPASLGDYIGHYATCLFKPLVGMDHERIQSALDASPAGEVVTNVQATAASLSGAGGSCGVVFSTTDGLLPMTLDTCTIAGSGDWWGPVRTIVGMGAILFALMRGVNVITKAATGGKVFASGGSEDEA